jgi:hypothetical protein
VADGAALSDESVGYETPEGSEFRRLREECRRLRARERELLAARAVAVKTAASHLEAWVKKNEFHLAAQKRADAAEARVRVLVELLRRYEDMVGDATFDEEVRKVLEEKS